MHRLMTLLLAVAIAGCGDDGTGPGQDGGTGPDGGTTDAALPGDAHVPEAHPRIYLNATQQARLTEALETPTAAATRFVDVVEVQLAGGDVYAFEPWHAALLYVLTGDVRYADYAVTTTDAWVAAEEALIAAGERADVAFDSYLYVGDHVGNLGLVYDWCHDRLTEAQRDRWVTYGNQAVWNVWHPEEAEWGDVAYPWSGWSIENPSNNYYYSFLRATMLLGLATLGENPEADGWVTRFREAKIGAELVPTFAADLAGGGSREGTGYGVAMAWLFHLYDLWAETTGERIADLGPHARDSIYWMLHAIGPGRDRLAPIGDHARESTAALFDYHRAYLLGLGALYPDDPGTLAARRILAESTVPSMDQGFMAVYDLLHDPTGRPDADPETLYPVYHATGTGQVFLRSGWDVDATYARLGVGPYTESHAHHDQGDLLVYRGGWLAWDANVDSHSGIHQEEEAHNLVRLEVDGTVLRQVEGTTSTLLALADDDTLTYLAADTAPAYGGAAEVGALVREVVWLKPGVFIVLDRADVSGAAVRKVFQLNVPVAPTVLADRVAVDGAGASLELFTVYPSDVTPVVHAWPDLDADYLGGYRVDVADATTGASRLLHVLSVDGEVSAVAEVTAAGHLGVELTLADGRVATVRFADAGIGGSVELTDGGSPVYSIPLEPGVATLPRLR